MPSDAAPPIDAVLLASFGGPEAPDEVLPFLERVTAGRDIPRERLEAVAENYYALGGVSPINGENRSLVDHLRRELSARGLGPAVYWGNRNSAPYFPDALRQVRADGHRRVLVVATSAYSSYSGCRQYRENLAAARAQVGLVDELDLVSARPYADREGFAAPFVDGLVRALTALADPGSAQVLFTTHSIPTAMAASSGPDEQRSPSQGAYERQHRAVAARVVAAAQDRCGIDPIAWRLVFQSRSGPTQAPWLEPDIGEAIRDAARDGRRSVVVVPIGFISDHVEVVWDLDRVAAGVAADLGLGFQRVPTPGRDPRFVSVLADIVGEALAGATHPSALCSGTCCRNPRGDLPVIPAC